MIIEIIDRIGGTPLRIDAAQVIIRNNSGTPICVAGEYGMERATRVAHVQDGEEFDRTLRAFGYTGPQVKVESVRMPPPPSGARTLGQH